MSQVRTLLKDINPEEMGFTLSHEHLLCSPPHWIWKKEEDLLLDDPEKTLADMKDYERLGGCSIVDATAVDYGRECILLEQRVLIKDFYGRHRLIREDRI